MSNASQQHLDQLQEELQAAYGQLGYTLDEVERIRIKRRIDNLEAQIRQLQERNQVSPGNLVSEPSNPFGDAGRITDPARFFDREELLRQVFEELGKGNSISLVGDSQSGKSKT